MFDAVLGTSIPKRAAEKGLVSYHLTNIRDFATDAHKSVDDKPFGGGPGMVMMCQTLFDAVESVERQDAERASPSAAERASPSAAERASPSAAERASPSAASKSVRILLTPQGRLFDQSVAEELAAKDRLLLIAGHYEGFDDRIARGLQPMELSIGDYVLSGGELAAMVVLDAVVRLLPGALGAEEGAADESFADGLLEYPQYTRPREFRGMTAPQVLLGGNHAEIAKWRLEQKKQRTKERRPDLWQAYLRKISGGVADKPDGVADK
ncbi:MAG: tRNA (guanosine(37)-N1)-methyltransferase TrmD [Tepidisphaeraceae bacterium]